ncbi:MAG: phosphate ABC transporter ATP-binding protein PstB [Spirochaetia bacterium]|nr:phosphate ABC transporter ATP-binding protein PstB [Spirochaetia bacterium]
MSINNKINVEQIKLSVENLDLFYGNNHALKKINIQIPANQITAFIGPSGCGKSSLLKCLNRMNDLISNIKITGQITVDNENIYDRKQDVTQLRRKVGMVFQKPNPFPKSIFDNVAYGIRIAGIKDKEKINNIVENSLKRVGLWKEVENRLQDSAMSLSGGQAQRLCIARTIATHPDVILMDEPTSALDPISTQVIEELILELKESYTVVIVTHNMQQAARISDITSFFYLGELVEVNPTNKIFTTPENKLTEKYITGRFG